MTIIIITALLSFLTVAIVLIIRLQKRNRELTNENRRLALENARTGERLNVMAENEVRSREATRDRFAALAAEALERNAKNLNEQNRMQIAELLAPMKENLDDFRKSYTDAYGKESEKRAMLEQQLSELFNLNRSIGEEARRLGEALKGNTSVQGQWGEMVLENILERSGLLRGQDYFVQKTVDAEDSNARPDIVISCPGERNIVVDSKVSMSDYLRMINAPDRQTVKAAGEAHVASVRKHVAELKRKNYQSLLSGRNADFVMMFIPHEGAYLAAMQLDNTLWQTAFDSRVIIVSPTHLVSVVKLVEMLWRQDKQNRNAIEIAELGAKMLDKLSNFLSDLGKIKRNLESAQKAYDSAITKFEGRCG
ncbi:MAG: DNA recombination protein RmuC, partial [Muribaculaceae bacterium]|nr:DNA recombination protein RmuC [Muribaculaceae bacterium]